MRKLVLVGILLLSGAAAAQTRDIDRGRKIVDQAIQALGGQAWLNTRDYRAEGTAFSFTRFEEMAGRSPLVNYERYPDKFRQEVGKHHDAIYIVNGEQGWDADYKGVAKMAEAEVERIRFGRSLNVDTILRFRLKEPGITLTFTGTDMIDGRIVEKVEFADAGNNVVTISFDQMSHLPLRREWERKLPNREREQNVETLGKYVRAKNSEALFPYYIRRERNGFKIFEAFYNEVEVGKAPESLFERPGGKERIDVPSRKK
jgi:hypothetical protein